jgi:type 1 fimbriae regulatory protein FimB
MAADFSGAASFNSSSDMTTKLSRSTSKPRTISSAGTQPLRSDELRAISAWLKERVRMKPMSKAFFVSEQRKQMHRSTVNLLLITYSKAASLPLLAHPHMLRHACGFALADQGADTRLIQDYL